MSGECEGDRARIGDKGNFLRSSNGKDENDGNKGTDCARVLLVSSVNDWVVSDFGRLEVEFGLLLGDTVATRLYDTLWLGPRFGSEWIRAWLVSPMELLVSPSLESHFIRFNCLPISFEAPMLYSSVAGGDTERLEPRGLGGLFDDNNSSSLSSTKRLSSGGSERSLAIFRAFFIGECSGTLRTSSESLIWDRVLLSKNGLVVIGDVGA